MTDDIRWIALSDRYLVPRLRLPEPTTILFVAAVDVLVALEQRPVDELVGTLELLLARHDEHNPR